MAGFFENLLRDAAGAFFGSEYLRDFTHASKTFRTNSYQNAPKLKFLFHTYFDINTNITGPGQNFGLLVKTIKLPSFTLKVDELNQYNRKRLIQTKIKYDPISITFHDDGGNTIRNLWKSYYTYYYKDGTKPNVAFGGVRGGGRTASQHPGDVEDAGNGDAMRAGAAAAYNNRNLYDKSIQGNADWGYIGEPAGGGVGPKLPFFKNITVFGLNQHNWVAYTLINPIITKCNHDTYSYADQAGTMEVSMDIDYETVVYDSGGLDGRTPDNIISGFGDAATYDRRLSPIAKPGSNANILGQGGLVNAAGGVIDALSHGDVIGAVQTAGTAYNTFHNVNLGAVAQTEALTGLQNAATNTPNVNRNAGFNIPGPYGASPGPAGTAAMPTTGAVRFAPAVGASTTAGKQLVPGVVASTSRVIG